MIRIIDATLCMLDDYNLTREQIYCFLKLMKEIGINNVQISLAIYNSLDGKLPEGIHYFLEVDTASYINEEYPKRYLCMFTAMHNLGEVFSSLRPSIKNSSFDLCYADFVEGKCKLNLFLWQESDARALFSVPQCCINNVQCLSHRTHSPSPSE